MAEFREKIRERMDKFSFGSAFSTVKIMVEPAPPNWVNAITRSDIEMVLAQFKNKYLEGLVEVREGKDPEFGYWYGNRYEDGRVYITPAPEFRYRINPERFRSDKLKAVAHEVGHHIHENFPEGKEFVERMRKRSLEWEESMDLISYAVLDKLGIRPGTVIPRAWKFYPKFKDEVKSKFLN